jgi:hypothetical protein
MVYLKSFLVGVAALVSVLSVGYCGLYRLGSWTIHTSLLSMAPTDSLHKTLRAWIGTSPTSGKKTN